MIDTTLQPAATLAPPLMREGELAARWKISPKTLQNMRVSGEGPPFVKLGRAVRYATSDILAYERQRTANSTSIPLSHSSIARGVH